ncbi:MAG: hypothetical protein GXO64_05095 [Candidatus Micrarchaeota archaeon]|nr:hypothetical protein [Candidatus Micrarchaeota archaeon]
MPRIIIVPTSHIAEDSIRKIRKAIENEEPDCVAVELDAPRFHALKSRESASSLELIKNVGFATFAIFWLLKYLQQKLGGMVGVVPGADMLSAVEEASKRNINVAFIDMDIRMTAYRFKTEIPFREKLKMITYAIRAMLLLSVGKYFVRKSPAIDFKAKEIKNGRLQPSKKAASVTDFKAIDLTKVPEEDFISQAMEIFEEQFPNLYRVLVTERNEIMAKNLIALSQRHEKIVAVVGAGHKEGIEEEMKK